MRSPEHLPGHISTQGAAFGVLLPMASPNPPSRVGDIWSGSGWTVPRDAAEIHTRWGTAMPAVGGTPFPGLAGCCHKPSPSPPLSPSPVGLRLPLQSPPSSHLVCPNHPQPALPPPRCLPPTFSIPAEEILPGMESVSLCFLPSVAVLRAKRPGRNLAGLRF